MDGLGGWPPAASGPPDPSGSPARTEIDSAVPLMVAPFAFQLRSCSRARSKGAGEIWIGPENGTSMSRIR